MHVYTTAEELPEPLRGCVGEGGLGAGVFRHPLYVALMPLMVPAPIEEMIRLRQERVDAQLAEGDYEGVVWRHERPFRMDLLLRMVGEGRFDPKRPRDCIRFWRLAGAVWRDAEHDETDLIWSQLMWAQIPHQQAMTSSESRRRLRALPERVTVWKGIHAEDEDEAHETAPVGWSWTLDRDVAIKFAHRLIQPPNRPFLARAEVPKNLILALMPERAEDEVLIEPEEVYWSEITPAPHRRRAR